MHTALIIVIYLCLRFSLFGVSRPLEDVHADKHDTVNASALASVDVRQQTNWCLPGAVHQAFSGLMRKQGDRATYEGKWEGDHW